MKTYIIIHLLPHELDWFEWQAKQLKLGSYLLDKSADSVVIDVTLNLNLVDWSGSQLPEAYFTDKFLSIVENYLDWCKVCADVNRDGSCNGCADKRRTSIETFADATNFIYLDSDLIFKPDTLHVLVQAAKYVKEDYYIISPQITKLWDSSWDVLVNENHLKDPWDNKTFVDPYRVAATDYGPYSLRQLGSFKLGGGWFNMISAKLLQKIGVPEAIGPYGPDDTYLMSCCQLLKLKGVKVNQYVVENLLVNENHKYRANIYEPYLRALKDRTAFREEGDKVLADELHRFYTNLDKLSF